MPLSPTPNYALEKPTPGADDDIWGEALNRNSDQLDLVVKAAETDAAAALTAAQDAQADIDQHAALRNNPHAVTLAQVGGISQATADGRYVAKPGDTMTGPLVIAGSSGSNMLRVTQTGAGNAILVEDSANPDATPFVVDASGRVGIGTLTPTVALDVAGAVNTTGNIAISKAAPALTLNKAASGQTNVLYSQTNAVTRWAMHLGGTQAEAAEAGSDFALNRYNDAGTVNAIPAFAIERLTGKVGVNTQVINFVSQPSQFYVRQDGVDAGSGITLHNTQATSDATMDLRFVVGTTGQVRGRIRSQKEAATTNGRMVFSTFVGAVESDVLTLLSNKDAIFNAVVQTNNLYGGGTAQEVSLTPSWASGVAPPAWPNTNGGRISALGNTHANYAAGAVMCWSGSGNTGVNLLNAATSWSTISDEREKHILGNIADGLQAIMALNPIRFRYLFEDSEAPARIGFGAMNVQQQIPEAVTPVPKIGADGLPTGEMRLALAPVELLPHMVRAMQQMHASIQALTARAEAAEALLARIAAVPPVAAHL